jgi:hypothetical protein
VAWVTLIDTMLSIIAHHGRPVVSQKQWLLLFLLVFFVARALFAARSFLINYGLCGFDDVEHQIRLARLPCWRPCC